MKSLFVTAAALALFSSAPVFAQAANDTNGGAANPNGVQTGANSAVNTPSVGAAAAGARTDDAATANPTVADADATAALGAPPSVYPVCKTRTQDRCREPGQGTRTASRSRTHKSAPPAAAPPATNAPA